MASCCVIEALIRRTKELKMIIFIWGRDISVDVKVAGNDKKK